MIGQTSAAVVCERVMKEKVKREYFCHMKKILKTKLNSKNKIMAIKSLAAPVMISSFVILPWLKPEIEKNGQKNKKNIDFEWNASPKGRCGQVVHQKKWR